MTQLMPIQKTHRIQSLDIIRGFALLGILLMNIQSFSMPDAAYLNPTSYGDLTGINLGVWAVSHLLIDSKFMAMFSMLFGAGVLLFCEHIESKHGTSFFLHYRRMFWLMLFGLMHAHLIWSGDVLFLYAVCGFWIYWFRHCTTKTLWITGIGLLSVGWLLNAFTQWGLAYMPDADLASLQSDWRPATAVINAEITAFTGTWQEQFHIRSEHAWFLETFVLLYLMIWRAGGLMLIGMALYKQGLFSQLKDSKDILRNGIFFAVSGFSLVGYGIYYNFEHQWVMEYSQFAGSQFNYIGSVLVALAYLYLFVFMIQTQRLTTIQNRLAYVGRMAFSNYISQSVICTFIFYGFGLGLFGQFERWQQLLVVLVVWSLILIWSPIWLNKFRYGPLEWCWRSLTYWNPLKK